MKVRVVREREAAARWVTPLPDEYPSFRVEMVDLGTENTAQVLQRNGAGGRDPRLVDSLKAGKALVSKSINQWEGHEKLVEDFADPLREAGLLDENGQVPVTEDGKALFRCLEFEEEDPDTGKTTFTSLFNLSLRALRKQLEAERKN